MHWPRDVSQCKTCLPHPSAMRCCRLITSRIIGHRRHRPHYHPKHLGGKGLVDSLILSTWVDTRACV
ncbi:hypothetical protein F383_00557 [Gossypium arboreum]|uniref:Uncharacterized protein n=1 Tax=Gossypium arboreum TaxID=29729 RepID=A0A0B0PN39_GOSAR|nr:hypothetical protein F383_00557 [Gossypium arboreum]